MSSVYIYESAENTILFLQTLNIFLCKNINLTSSLLGKLTFLQIFILFISYSLSLNIKIKQKFFVEFNVVVSERQ